MTQSESHKRPPGVQRAWDVSALSQLGVTEGLRQERNMASHFYRAIILRVRDANNHATKDCLRGTKQERGGLPQPLDTN